MSYTITCDDPLHATRSALPGWSNNLGTSDKQTFGYLCGACAPFKTADPASVNADTLRTRALSALTNNAAFLATVAGRRTAIASGKATATTGQTATITTVAQAQTQIRSVWTVVTQIATALDDLNNQAEANARQNDGVIRLLLGALDSIADS